MDGFGITGPVVVQVPAKVIADAYLHLGKSLRRVDAFGEESFVPVNADALIAAVLAQVDGLQSALVDAGLPLTCMNDLGHGVCLLLEERWKRRLKELRYLDVPDIAFQIGSGPSVAFKLQPVRKPVEAPVTGGNGMCCRAVRKPLCKPL